MKDRSVIDGMKRQATECVEQAFNRGYKQGDGDGYDRCKADYEKLNAGAYERGLNDAWECARKMVTIAGRS